MSTDRSTGSFVLPRPSPGKNSHHTTVLYATQTGHETLDSGQGGGNPFASALTELLERPKLIVEELHSEIVPLTSHKSGGYQLPDVLIGDHLQGLQLKPVPNDANRVALVFVYSDYRSVGAASLPGAARDLQRVSTALIQAGFEVSTAIDPSRNDVIALLDALSHASEDAEIAVIYSTGHGVEHQGNVYLLPNHYALSEMMSRLPELGIPVFGLGQFMNASHANLLFFGGCRTSVR